MKRQRTILALGGGGWMMEPENPLLDNFMLELTGKDNPRIALLPTPTGDSDNVIRRFYEAFADKAQPSLLPLFKRDRPAAMLLDQDIVYVSGGNTVNALAIWRAHKVDAVLRRCWENGVILSGVSAGALCWFEGGITDSFRIREMDPLRDGLGFLPGSCCPHYDGEAARRPLYTAHVSAKTIPPGIAVSDYAGALYRGTELVEVVSSRPEGAAWKVGPDGYHHPLAVRYLGATTP